MTKREIVLSEIESAKKMADLYRPSDLYEEFRDVELLRIESSRIRHEAERKIASLWEECLARLDGGDRA